MDRRVVFMSIALAVVLLIFVLMGVAAGTLPQLDADLCPAVSRQTGHAVVLIDETDAYSPEQANTLKSIVLDVRDRLAQYARLSVVLIGADVQEPPLTAFSLCNPGRSTQVNGLIQTDKSKSLFDQPLDKLIAALETQTTQPHSPILQTISGVAHLPNFQNGKRELDIVSDLLENSSLISQYHTPISFPAFAASSDYAQAKANLKGVSVRLFYLKRPETEDIQTAAQRAFWVDYFQASGARDVSWCGVGAATTNRREVTCEPVSN